MYGELGVLTAFGSWATSILAVAVIGAVGDLLLPEGKIRNAVRAFFAVLTALIVITPIPKLFKSGQFSFDFSPDSIELDESYLQFNQEKHAELLENYLQTRLKADGYGDVVCEITMKDSFTAKNVVIKSWKLGIDENLSHIDKYDLTKAIAEYLNIEEGCVTHEI